MFLALRSQEGSYKTVMLHHNAMYSEEINIADILFTGSDLGMEAHLEVEACQM